MTGDKLSYGVAINNLLIKMFKQFQNMLSSIYIESQKFSKANHINLTISSPFQCFLGKF